ncbi:hypothetical protein AK812_SmicGene42763 [Symbiodinium microadriaticum]|uniref:Uncharacterized protein n=1 Tax=Symbiodinium microadriaticum TaxID=2951 RepID=A0A1Q9C2P9_SYMMI|nr:hypothetical protein AK812_SmicGene42763 [Symbiodinium microadriaticum]
MTRWWKNNRSFFTVKAISTGGKNISPQAIEPAELAEANVRDHWHRGQDAITCKSVYQLITQSQPAASADQASSRHQEGRCYSNGLDFWFLVAWRTGAIHEHAGNVTVPIAIFFGEDGSVLAISISWHDLALFANQSQVPMPSTADARVLSAEFWLPVLVLYTASSSTNFSRWLRTCWILLVALFHVVCWALVGPNFVRQIALLMLSSYSVWHPTDSTDKDVIEGSHTRAWLYRVGYAVVLLMLWLCNQLWSDIDHIRGATAQESYHDMLWPVGELSMYVVPSASSNYVRSLFLEIAIASLICLRMHFDVSQPTLDKGGT